jgi:hypothetical protein
MNNHHKFFSYEGILLGFPFFSMVLIIRVIQGGNHARFGNYGLQPGDGTATISAADQQEQAADLTVRLLRAVEGE